MLGHSAMAAHQTLDLWILVRIRVPQPELQGHENRNEKLDGKNELFIQQE
jgi:hypothetical protein